MEYLRKSDLRALLNFLRNCYAIREFESFEQFLRHLVTTLAQLVTANAVFYMEISPNKKNAYHIGTEPYIEAPEAITLWAEYGQEHPAARHILRTGDCSARSVSEFWSRRQFQATGLYNALYRRYGVQDDIAMPICTPLTVVGWHSDRCFTARERLMADLARLHLVQACENAKLVSGMRQQIELFRQGTESAALATISCDSEGRVQFSTALARQYLAEYFGASRNLDRHLPDELLRWMQYQNAQLFKNDVPPVRSPLAVRKGPKQLTVRLLSNAGANLLFLEEKSPPLTADILSSLGLSRRESEVLVWVAQGKTNGEIASILSMSIGTVKKHLANVFQKLGVETRTAAAALALSAHLPSEESDR